MIPLTAALAGAVWGGLLARRRHGNHLDILQYAAGFAMAFGVVGLFAGIVLGLYLG